MASFKIGYILTNQSLNLSSNFFGCLWLAKYLTCVKAASLAIFLILLLKFLMSYHDAWTDKIAYMWMS